MTDKITKLIRNMSPKQRLAIEIALRKVRVGDLRNLDVKTLKNRPGAIRIRVGNFRIIVRKNQNDEITILNLARRSERTYKS